MAYIIPAYKVFDDIENRFGVPPRLPSETAPDPVQNRIVRSSEPTRHYTLINPTSPGDEAKERYPRYLDMSIILGNSSNRTANVEPSWRAALGQPAVHLLCPGVISPSLYAYPTKIFGNPPQHLNEDKEALTSRFNDLLRRERLNQRRAACGDSLGKIQQHGASLRNNHYRRLPIASMRETRLHILFESLQFPLGHPVETSWHREKRPVGHHNAVAHFEGTLQSLMDWMDRKTPVEGILHSLMEETIRHWIVGFDENQIISLLTVKLIDHLVDYRQVSWLAIIGISCRFPAGANDPEEFWSMLSEGRSAWSEVPSDRFNSKAFYHPSPDVNGTTNHQGGHFLTQDKPAFDASFFEITRSKWYRLHRLHLKTAYEALEDAGMPRFERPRGLFLWKSRDMFSVRAVDLKRHSPHHIHSASTVEALFSLIAQGTCPKTSKSWYPNNYQLPGIASNNAQVMRHGTLEICCPGIDMILVTQIQKNNGYKPQLIASFPGLSRAFSELYREQSSAVSNRTDARVLESIRLLFALASLSPPASSDDVDFEACFWDIMFQDLNGRGIQRGL